MKLEFEMDVNVYCIVINIYVLLNRVVSFGMWLEWLEDGVKIVLGLIFVVKIDELR